MDTPQLASSFEATINKFDKNFSAHLLDLLARLSIYSTSDCEHGMASVISRWVRAAFLSWALSLPPWTASPRFPRWLPAVFLNFTCLGHHGQREASSAQA